MEKKRSVLLIGGPEMGKTNFLGRFWGAIYNSDTGRLRKGPLPTNLEHLGAILRALLGGSFAARTSREEHWLCEIPLVSAEDSAFCGDLVLPDCSGEEWRRIYKNREWSSKWEDLIPQVRGCLVFIRPGSDEMRAPLDWMTCCKWHGEAAGDQQGEDEAPTQVEVVDWLQCLHQAYRERAIAGDRLRVGVIVAACNALPDDRRAMSPDEFIRVEAPLLHQFMHTNPQGYEFAAFGVSVVGGDLKFDDEFRLQYQQGDPHVAGYVVHTLDGTREESLDHTIPVAWAMGLEVSPSPGGGGGA